MGIAILLLVGLGIFLILAAIYLLYSAHLLTPVKVSVESFDKIQVAYVPVTGPYNEAYKRNFNTEKLLGQKVTADVTKWPGFGVYYDNPQVTPKDKLRSVVGKILPEGAVSDSDKHDLKQSGIRFTTLNLNKCAVIHYPFDSMTAMYAGMMRSYPALNTWLVEHKEQQPEPTAMVELYGYVDGKISFVAPLAQENTKGNILMNFPTN